METKFLSDGRKVALVGKLNNEEWIVQEVFVTDGGDEVPSGERFTSKSLHDSPVKSYKDKEAERTERQLQDKKVELEQVRRQVKSEYLDLETRKAVKRSLQKSADAVQSHQLETLTAFLCGEIKWLVVEGFSFPEIKPFEKGVEDIDHFYNTPRFDGLKLISLFGRSDGDLEFRINRYGDGSGGWTRVTAHRTYEEAAQAVMHQLEEAFFGEKQRPNFAKPFLESPLVEYASTRMVNRALELIEENLRKYRESHDKFIQEHQRKTDKNLQQNISLLKKFGRHSDL